MSAAPAQPAWPYGLHNATRTYGRLIRPVEDTSAGLLCHHLQSLLELLVSPTASSSADSEEDNDGWAGANFSGLDDPGLCASSLIATTTSSRALTPTKRTMTPLGSSLCVMGNSGRCHKLHRCARRGCSHATTHGVTIAPARATLRAREGAQGGAIAASATACGV
jgi:hypothetical protein